MMDTLIKLLAAIDRGDYDAWIAAICILLVLFILTGRS